MNYSEARAAGLPRYNGKPCEKGHGTERYSSGGDCVECNRMRVLRAKKGTDAQPSRAAIAQARIAAILAMLAEGPADAEDIRERVGISPVSLWRILGGLRGTRLVHVRQVRPQARARPRAVYILGPGPEPAPLAPRSNARLSREYRARRGADPEKQMEYDKRQRARYHDTERAAPKRDPLTVALFGNPTQTRK